MDTSTMLAVTLLGGAVPVVITFAAARIITRMQMRSEDHQVTKAMMCGVNIEAHNTEYGMLYMASFEDVDGAPITILATTRGGAAVAALKHITNLPREEGYYE